MQPTYGTMRAYYSANQSQRSVQVLRTFLTSVIKELGEEVAYVELVHVLRSIIGSTSLITPNFGPILSEVKDLLFTLPPGKLESIKKLAEKADFKEMLEQLQQPQPFLSFFTADELTPSFLLYQITLKTNSPCPQEDLERHLSNEHLKSYKHLQKIVGLLEARRTESDTMVTSFPLTTEEQSSIITELIHFFSSIGDKEKALYLVQQAPENIKAELFPVFEKLFS
ncbi:MAG: hypothetical protein ACSNEK_05260 [Parachlamydiaceae bacterium]